MVDKATIQSAKAVDLNIILDEFNWRKDRYGRIRCPHIAHVDRMASCSCNGLRNTCKCFGCGEVFDTIDLYQSLSEKVDGRVVPFYKAVEEILELDSIVNGNTGSAVSLGASNTVRSNNSYRSSGVQGNNNSSPYEMIINNSRLLTGYELEYLHQRAITLYDSFVYDGKIYTAQSINNALQKETDQSEINRLNEIKSSGTFYRGIVSILKANKIQIKHNFWQGMNSIIYLIDYDSDEDDDLCWDKFFRNTERHMAIQKSLDGNHTKRALGTSDFNFITLGFEYNKNRDIFICEGIEDGLTCAMNGIKSISLNSVANTRPLIRYLKEDYIPLYNERFVTCFDHDEAGRKATQELKDFFEAYNQNPSNEYRYSYGVCDYPQQFHDINDYWVSKVFR